MRKFRPFAQSSTAEYNKGNRIGALLASVRNTCSGTQHQTSLNDFCHTVTQAWSDVGEKWPGTDGELHTSIKRRFGQLCADLQPATCSEREDPVESPEKLLVSWSSSDKWRQAPQLTPSLLKTEKQSDAQRDLLQLFEELTDPKRKHRTEQLSKSARPPFPTLSRTI